MVESGSKRSRHKAADVAGCECFCAAKDPGQSVIVGRRNRVKFVVMAARTSECHPEKRTPHGVNLFVNDVHPQLFFVLFFIVDCSQHHIADAGQLLIVLSIGNRRQKIARDMLPDQLIEWLVVVERFDDIVPEPPRIRQHHAPSAARGFRKPCDVQPVPSPALAEPGRCELSVNCDFNGTVLILSPHFRELSLLVKTRRKSCEHKRQTADEHIRSCITGDDLLFTLRCDKAVHIVLRPAFSGEWNLRLDDRTERPELTALFDVDRSFRSPGAAAPWISSTRANPRFKVIQNVVRQLAIRRHFESLVPQSLHEQTVLRLPGHQCRPGISAGQRRVPRIQSQAPLDFFGLRRVARIAVLDQDGPDAGFEEFHLFGRGRFPVCGRIVLVGYETCSRRRTRCCHGRPENCVCKRPFQHAGTRFACQPAHACVRFRQTSRKTGR